MAYSRELRKTIRVILRLRGMWDATLLHSDRLYVIPNRQQLVTPMLQALTFSGIKCEKCAKGIAILQ